MTPIVAAFTCQHCGFQSAVRVNREGESTEVDDVLRRVECPRCNHIEEPFRPIGSARLVLLALVGAITCFVEALDGNLLWVVCGVACLAAMGGLFWKGQQAAWVLRSSSVEFTDEPVPVRQLAGRSCAVCTKRIVTDDAGVWCPTCGATSHRDVCASRHAVSAHAGTEGGGPFRAAGGGG